MNLPRRLVLGVIRVYQVTLSPLLGARCRYHPSCSRYAMEAIESFGILRGSVLAAWRLLRCNPFSHGGYDPVTAQTLFRRPPRTPRVPASDS
jgi:putative membrane protein insertion efficiency factor